MSCNWILSPKALFKDSIKYFSITHCDTDYDLKCGLQSVAHDVE